MPVNDKDKMENRVLETANRFRHIRAASADESDQARRDDLCEELEKTLATFLPAQRDEFLRRLLEQLATVGSAVQSGAQEQESQGTSTIGEPGFRNVDSLIQSLLEIIPALTEEQKLIIDRRLQEAGLRPVAAPCKSTDSGQELKERLQISGELSASRRDLAELSTVLAEFALKLEPLVWNTWRALSPRSNIRPQGSLAKKIEQFLCKDCDVSSDSVGEDLKVLQRLIAALTTAVSRAGGQFAKSHAAKFSPSEIAALVRMEPGGVFVSHEVKCWRKYVELAERLDEDAIDVEIKKGVVDYVESLGKGMGR
ncbi:MAG: hypothetical protein JSW66_20385 [Phycisphaerales bacterium]|nr:MAG: hypothetical protein JSW66_20385 [Phycisphaerales bacterium]